MLGWPKALKNNKETKFLAIFAQVVGVRLVNIWAATTIRKHYKPVSFTLFECAIRVVLVAVQAMKTIRKFNRKLCVSIMFLLTCGVMSVALVNAAGRPKRGMTAKNNRTTSAQPIAQPIAQPFKHPWSKHDFCGG